MKRWLMANVLLLALATSCLAVEFRPYTRGSFAAIKQSHAGRSVVIHFWSAGCGPCIAELPRLAAMRAEHPEVDVVMVSTDTFESQGKIEKRLERNGLDDATNFVFDDDFTERLHFEADPSWQGELPFTIMVNSQGATTRVIGPLGEEQFDAWLETTSIVNEQRP